MSYCHASMFWCIILQTKHIFVTLHCFSTCLLKMRVLYFAATNYSGEEQDKHHYINQS